MHRGEGEEGNKGAWGVRRRGTKVHRGEGEEGNKGA